MKVIKGFDRWSITLDFLKAEEDEDDDAIDLSKLLRLVTSDKLWILARKHNVDE